MKHFPITLLGVFIFVVGCAPTSPVLKDPDFQSAFKSRKVHLVAPGSAVEPDEIKAIRALKLPRIQIPNNLMSDVIPFHANTDEERFLVLKKALYDDSPHNIIWALRGGYGSARLIDRLKHLPKPKHEKLFIGYSDVTALHLFLSQQWQWKTVHGSVLSEILYPNKEPENFKRIADIVENRVTVFKLPNIVPLNKKAFYSKRITGRLTGGNLTLVETSIGTNWEIKSTDKILFLEDVGEKGYKVDRTLHHLKQAGIFRNVKALVFGEFANSKDDKVDLALERFALEADIPVFKTDQFGHGKKNYPLIYNANTEISIEPARGNFSLLMHLK